MLKGCQKNVIILRGTDSEIFEEAFFILKRDAEIDGNLRENDMISEAKRILEANATSRPVKTVKNIRSAIVCFSVGAVSAFFISALLGVIIFAI